MAIYYVVLDDINQTGKTLGEASGQWQTVLTRIQNANEAMLNTDTITGKTADSIKEYISSVHTVLLARMQLLLMAVYTTFGTYNKAYLDIDDDANTVFSTQELIEVVELLEKYRKIAADVDDIYAYEESIANPKLDSVNYENIHYRDISGLLRRFDNIMQNIKNIVEETTRIETTFPDDLLTDLKTDLSDIRTLIAEQMSTNPGTFDPQSLAKSQAFINLVEGYESAYQTVNEQMADAQAAAEGRAKCEQQKIEEREEEAKKWRVLTAIACTTVNIVATATCGPAGTIIAGAVTGAIEAAVNEGLDQYVATGAGWGELDWGSIAIEGTFGALKGGLTSAIGCGVTGQLNAIGSTASAWSKGLQTAGWNLAGNMGKTTVNHLVDGAKEFTFAVVDGKDFKDAWNAGTKEFTDGLWSDYCGDAVSAGFSGVNAGISTRYSGKDDKWKKNLGNVVSSTLEKPAEGVATRFGAALNGEGEWSDVLDGKRILKDTGIGFTEGIVGTAMDAGADKLKETFGFDDWQKTRGKTGWKVVTSGTVEGVKTYVEKEITSGVESVIESGFTKEAFDNWMDGRGDRAVSAWKSGVEEGMTTRYKHKEWEAEMDKRVAAENPQPNDGKEHPITGKIYRDKKTGEDASMSVEFKVVQNKVDSGSDKVTVNVGSTVNSYDAQGSKLYGEKVGNNQHKNAKNYEWFVRDYDPVTGEAKVEFRKKTATNGRYRYEAVTQYQHAEDALSDFKGELKGANGSSTSGDGANFIGSSDNTGGSGGFTIDNRSDEFQNLRNMLGL